MKTFGKVWLSVGLLSVAIGICLLILAAATGFTVTNGATYSFAENYSDEIKSLNFQIDYGKVEIIEGDEFDIDANGLYEEGTFESEVEDGVWIIKQTSSRKMNFFGIRIPAVSIFGDHFDPEITITLPKGFEAEDVKLELSAGSLNADSIKSETGKFTVDSGEMVIEQIEVSEQSTYNVGAGYMKLDQMKAKNISLDCGIGYVNMEGVVTGKNDINCGVGKVKLDLEGDIKGYSYDIESSVGSITVNGKDYYGNVDRGAYEEALGSFNMECGIGNITLEIN